MGSEGAFGVVTAVRVRVRPLPEAKRYEGWRFGSFGDGAAAMRALAQADLLPTVLRLSDENETAVNLASPDEVGASGGAPGGGCLLIAGYEGATAAVDVRRAAVGALLRDAGGAPLGDAPGEAWSHGRFDGPYLRDALLDVGVLVETLETVTFWSNLDAVYTAVKAALTAALGEGTMVLCHISHVYPTGASLYFTVAARQTADPVAQWTAAKTAASDAISATGASITHHHAVGRDHLPWLAREIGPVGVEILRAVKQRLDPTGVLNPGILIP
jgi:alkyldihydroxyacetonephosphate synthase